MSGATRLYRVSAPLQQLLGKEKLSRPQAIKEFWAYVKTHKLQDPSDGRVIQPNEALKQTFQVSGTIHFTQVMGLMSKHLHAESPSNPHQ